MGRRSLRLFGILLFCVFAWSCSKKDNPDELITTDNDIYIEEEGLNEDIDMADNEREQILPMHIDTEEEISSEIINQEMETTSEIGHHEEVFTDTIYQEEAYNSRELAVGSLINTIEFNQDILDSLFYIEELSSDLIDRITGKSYKEDADIPYSDLRYIRVLHTGFDGSTYIGEIMVNKAIAQDVIDIFRELYNIEYPIEKMLLIDEYDADDIKSMADNNSSSFNYRLVDGTTRRSVHSDGLAIDINPLYNPYVRTEDDKLKILPEEATEYVDRDKDNRYYIRKGDPCYNAFVSRGFTWGGEWRNSKDYQHFEKRTSN